MMYIIIYIYISLGYSKCPTHLNIKGGVVRKNVYYINRMYNNIIFLTTNY